MENLFATLEASGLAQTMRRSIWLYPVANVAHVVGLMGFFAAVAAMDVRAWRAATNAELRATVRALRPVAIGLFLLQVATGVLLFLPEATHIADNPVFRLKLVAVAAAVVNLALFEAVLRRGSALAQPTGGLRAAALASLVLWLGVASLGRLIAYF